MFLNEAWNVSRETFDCWQRYQSLVKEWNPIANLMGNKEEEAFIERHILDSLQLLPFVPKGTARILDVGTGAGFPGMVLALACPFYKVTLVERNYKKVVFLQEMIRSMNITNVTLYAEDIGDVKKEKSDIITARALSIPMVLERTRHCPPSQGYLFLTTLSCLEKVSLPMEIYPSLTNPNGRIAYITQG